MEKGNPCKTHTKKEFVKRTPKKGKRLVKCTPRKKERTCKVHTKKKEIICKVHVKIRARLICVYGKQSCPGIPMPGMWDFTGTVFLLGAYMKICSKMNMGYIEYVSKGVPKKWETL